MKKLIPLLLIVQTYAYAECTPKDLTDPDFLRSVGKENLIEHFSKPRDQDSVGWCGAYATSDSLSFEAGEAVSAMDVSLDYYTKLRSSRVLQDNEGVGLSAATELAEDIGYCPESIIPSDQSSSSNLGQAALLNFMKAFQEIADDFYNKKMPSDYCVTCAGDQYIKFISPALPNVTQEMIRDVLVANKGQALRSVRALMNKLCEGKRKILKFESPVWKETSGKPVTAMLDEALENNAMPSIEINTSHFAPKEIVFGGHANHALAVVGRRAGADGKCEYLIRNSWGKGCSFYLPQIAKNCDPAKGSFWLTSSQLDGNVNRIVHLKSSNNSNNSNNSNYKKNSNIASNGEGPVLPEDRSVEQNNKNEIVKEANPIPVNPGPIDNGRYKNPFAGLGFGDLMNTVMKGIETAVSGIWHSISNMFKY